MKGKPEMKKINLHIDNNVLMTGIVTLALTTTLATAEPLINLDARSSAVMSVPLDPGDYLVVPVSSCIGGAFTAWNAWGSVTGCSTTGLECATGWVSIYAVESPSIGFHRVSLLDSSGTREVVAETPELALKLAPSFAFTLDSQETVNFSIPDGPGQFIDNVGGMSLNIVSLIEDEPPPPSVGGSVARMSASRVLCWNLTKRQHFYIRDGARSWDCEAAGLVVEPGDIIWQGAIGIAD